MTHITVFLVPRGRKRAVPASTVDTRRGGRKGVPQHKVVGTKTWESPETCETAVHPLKNVSGKKPSATPVWETDRGVNDGR